ncbi:HAD-like protein [Zopfia rhizophila CBS 207.26]|uniref:HAD-like protein n=1 Tax=Zopfia rhizophila CBS 207.26 TaxID=1314779 RepID=A0A6A6EKH6_9PEZI|nr:HAD-like protein [Zopfia rhizophila CBS 207.26]
MGTNFPLVRACIFDVDGTLLNSEDIYTKIYNNILREYGKPDYPWSIKATQQSRGTPGTLRLIEWAQLPLSVSDWKAKEKAHIDLFTKSKLLPGISTLLQTLKTQTSPTIKLALASSASRQSFSLKTSHISSISNIFPEAFCRIFGDDPDMTGCEKKPSPDIFLLALKRLNDMLVADGEPPLKAEECLVFEDSIAGVESARRANMRVIWVPHPGLAEVCRGREMDVLMGRTERDGERPDFSATGLEEEKQNLSRGKRIMSEDGWAEMRVSLENFPYEEYGIQLTF